MVDFLNDLTPEEKAILVLVHGHDDPQMPYSRLKDIYCSIFDDKDSNFKTLIKKMAEEKDLVIKIPNLMDMRKRFISLTMKGTKVVDRL